MLFPDSVYITLIINETYKDGKCILKICCGLILSRDRKSGQLSVHQKQLIYHFIILHTLLVVKLICRGNKWLHRASWGGGDEEQF